MNGFISVNAPCPSPPNPPKDIKHMRATGRQRRRSGHTERLWVLHHHDGRGIDHAGDNRIARRAGADDPRAQRDGVGDARPRLQPLVAEKTSAGHALGNRVRRCGKVQGKIRILTPGAIAQQPPTLRGSGGQQQGKQDQRLENSRAVLMPPARGRRRGRQVLDMTSSAKFPEKKD